MKLALDRASIRLLLPKCHGGTDTKIATWSGMRGTNMTAYIVSGPTRDQQPVFDWSAPVCQTVWAATEGLSKVFNFDWQVVHTTGRTIAVVSPSDNNNHIVGIFWLTFFACFTVFGSIMLAIRYWLRRRAAAAEYEQIQSNTS